ncbi:MAG: lysophospholipase [Acidimicrobiia bacterium]|nr:lysophospholipase [Acidimicrobiia bacterium]
MGQASFVGAEGNVVYHEWQPEGDVLGVLLLVHGYAEHGARYAHVAAALNARGLAVYAEDHLGHGRSDGDRALITDFEHIVDDLRTLADIALLEHPGVPLVMAGHSMGGLLTARFAERYPSELAGAAFLGAVLGDWQWARGVLSLPEIPYQEAEYSGMSRDPETVRQYAEDPLVYHGQYKRSLLESEIVALDSFNAEIERITMPVLFLHGAADPYVPYRDSLHAIERMASDDKTMRVYPGARHELVNELNRDEVIRDLMQWCERVIKVAP